MQRLQAWLMPGLACFTLSVAALGFRMNPATPRLVRPALELASSSLMALGSVLIIVGFLVEITIPSLVWRFGRFGRFDRAIKRCIQRATRRILPDVALSYENWRGWQRDTSVVLSKHLGGEWHPQVTRFQSFGSYNVENQDYFRTMPPEHRKVLTIQQLNVLSELRRILRNKPESIMILDSNRGL